MHMAGIHLLRTVLTEENLIVVIYLVSGGTCQITNPNP